MRVQERKERKVYRHEPDNYGACNGFSYHLAENVCKDQKEIFDYIMDVFADMIQGNKRPKRNILTLIGEGIWGCNFLAEVLSDLLNENQVINLTSIQDFASLTDEIVSEKSLIICKDVNWKEFNSMWSHIKEVMNLTGSDKERKNTAQLLLTTSEITDRPLWLRHQHFVVIETENDKDVDTELLDIIENQKDECNGWEYLTDHLLQRDVTKRNFNLIPETEIRTKTIRKSLTVFEKFIHKSLTEGAKEEPDSWYYTDNPYIFPNQELLFDLVPECGGVIELKELLYPVSTMGFQANTNIDIDEIKETLAQIFGDVIDNNGSHVKVGNINNWRQKFFDHTGLRAIPDPKKQQHWL